MHDDVVDLMFSQVREHPLEPRAIGVSSRLAAVHELGGDERPQPVCLTLVRVSLGRDGEAVSRTPAICLTNSRDTNVRDGRPRRGQTKGRSGELEEIGDLIHSAKNGRCGRETGPDDAAVI